MIIWTQISKNLSLWSIVCDMVISILLLWLFLLILFYLLQLWICMYTLVWKSGSLIYNVAITFKTTLESLPYNRGNLPQPIPQP